MKTQRIVLESESGENLEFLKSRMIETWNWYGRQPIVQGYHNSVLYKIDSQGNVFTEFDPDWGHEFQGE